MWVKSSIQYIFLSLPSILYSWTNSSILFSLLYSTSKDTLSRSPGWMIELNMILPEVKSSTVYPNCVIFSLTFSTGQFSSAFQRKTTAGLLLIIFSNSSFSFSRPVISSRGVFSSGTERAVLMSTSRSQSLSLIIFSVSSSAVITKEKGAFI